MHSLAVLVPATAVETISDRLGAEFGALAVSVDDADAGSADEQAVFDEPGAGATGVWQRAVLTALFESEAAAVMAAAAIAAAASDTGATILAIAAVGDDDWVGISQSQFGATAITPDFWIVPSWCNVPPAARQSIRLDPGRAFGTGTHPTTRMCLRWLVDRRTGHAALWRRVLDYGTGSGVLAIAAGLCGAAAIDAVDLDPAAIEAAEVNGAANRVGLHVGPPELARGPYSLIVANILATPLKILAPLLGTMLDDEATLLLSGILERQANELAAAYAPWLTLHVADVEDGWILMAGTRSASSRMA